MLADGKHYSGVTYHQIHHAVHHSLLTSLLYNYAVIWLALLSRLI